MFCRHCEAEIYEPSAVVETFVGSGIQGQSYGQGVFATLDTPWGLLTDPPGVLYVLQGNNAVRMVTMDRTVRTFPAVQTQGLAVNLPSGKLWVIGESSFSDTTVLAEIGNSGYPTSADSAIFLYSPGITLDSEHYIYWTDAGKNQIFRWGRFAEESSRITEIFAGSGTQGAKDGNGARASFNRPTSIVADTQGNLYVWDSGNHLIRKMNQNRDVETVAGMLGVSRDSDGVGRNASFETIFAMAVDDLGNLILASGSSIRKMTPTGNVKTLAGSFTESGYGDGAGSVSRFSGATGVSAFNGMIFVADSGNHRIRAITYDPPPQPISGADINLGLYPGLQITGIVGRTYRVESSPDMNTWSEEAEVLLATSPYLWIDVNGLGAKKFYRALFLP